MSSTASDACYEATGSRRPPRSVWYHHAQAQPDARHWREQIDFMYGLRPMYARRQSAPDLDQQQQHQEQQQQLFSMLCAATDRGAAFMASRNIHGLLKRSGSPGCLSNRQLHSTSSSTSSSSCRTSQGRATTGANVVVLAGRKARTCPGQQQQPGASSGWDALLVWVLWPPCTL